MSLASSSPSEISAFKCYPRKPQRQNVGLFWDYFGDEYACLPAIGQADRQFGCFISQPEKFSLWSRFHDQELISSLAIIESLLLGFEELEEDCMIVKCMLHVCFAHYLLDEIFEGFDALSPELRIIKN